MTDADARHGEPQVQPPVRPLFRQAPIPPVDADGITVLSVGTGLFAIAAVILGLDWGRLRAAGDSWWLAVAIAGVVLGLIGLAYCWRRRTRR
jgi:hypothetical protein